MYVCVCVYVCMSVCVCVCEFRDLSKGEGIKISNI